MGAKESEEEKNGLSPSFSSGSVPSMVIDATQSVLADSHLSLSVVHDLKESRYLSQHTPMVLMYRRVFWVMYTVPYACQLRW